MPAIPTASTAQEEIAGALLAPDTLERAWRKGINPNDSLANNDGHGFFEALGDGVVTGPTLTNVNDFRAILIDGDGTGTTDMRRHRNAKIVATLGPASATEEMIRSLFLAGVDVFRLNFSHGTHEQHRERLQQIRTSSATSVGRSVCLPTCRARSFAWARSPKAR